MTTLSVITLSSAYLDFYTINFFKLGLVGGIVVGTLSAAFYTAQLEKEKKMKENKKWKKRQIVWIGLAQKTFL